MVTKRAKVMDGEVNGNGGKRDGNGNEEGNSKGGKSDGNGVEEGNGESGKSNGDGIEEGVDGSGKSDADGDEEGKGKGGKGDGNSDNSVGQGTAMATKRAIASGTSVAGDKESAGNSDYNCESN